MADQKISELNNITGANVDDATDELAIVDASANETKKITRAEFFKSVRHANVYQTRAEAISALPSLPVDSYFWIGDLGFQKVATSSAISDMSNVIPSGDISVKHFGAVGDGVTDDTAAIQAAFDFAEADQYTTYIPPGDYLISSTVTIKASCFGSGEQASRFITASADFDAVHLKDSADFLRLQSFGIYNLVGTSTGSGLTLVRNNNNTVLESIYALNFTIGFNFNALNFAQGIRMCRADGCTTGFFVDGRDIDDTGAGTTLVFNQCYTVGAITAFDLSYTTSITLIQPIVDVDPTTTTCIQTLGVGTLNVYDFHFEGTPGGDGQFFRFITSGSLGQFLNIFGGYVTTADLTGLNFDFMRLDGVNDDIEVNVFGVGSRNVTLDGNDTFKLTNTSGNITLNIHGFSWPGRDVDTSSLNGSYVFKDYTQQNALPILTGIASIESGDNISTGKSGNPRALVAVYDTDDTAVPTARAVVANQFNNGDFKVRFYDETGAEVTATPFNVSWVAW
jgi:hypothetical protein